MMKKLKNTDFLFVIALSLGLILHIYFVFVGECINDESYYVTVPFRLVNGDSLIQHEWHLTQFSSLFSYLPVYIWTAIKGSADGILIFLRFIYLFIHTTIAILIYVFFRKYKGWAIISSMAFYMQVPYRIMAISYHSMFVVFLLLLSLCLISIYQKESVRLYIPAGICFACCCICNPLVCFVFAIYLFVCALWTKREIIEANILRAKSPENLKKGKKLTKKQKRQQKQLLLDAFPNVENYNCFFKKETILRFSCGIFIIAIIAIIFYFLTGGTINSLFQNIENLLGSSEYNIASRSLLSKLNEAVPFFIELNSGMLWFLPAIFIALLFDKKKKHNIHRFAYLSISLLWIIRVLFVLLNSIEDMYLCAISLPFCVFFTICYILTENKNKTLLYFMYIPGSIAAFFQYLAADTFLSAIGNVLAINNVVGLFFAMDLFKEMHLISKKDSETITNKRFSGLCRCVLIMGICIQILFYGISYQHGQIFGKDIVKVTTGPYYGLYVNEEKHNEYNRQISDIDLIKTLSDKNDPVLLASFDNWMYLYLERPIATYTAWYRGALYTEQLINYYKENPKKIPEYIYISSSNTNSQMIQFTMDILGELFDFTREDLSNGVLLTVEDCKF